jgi:hypothetical protein
MARLKFRTDGTIALFDPSDDPFPPFPGEALLHLPPTLPPQAADQAQPHLPTEIPPAQTQSHLPAVQSEAAADALSLALQLTPALTQADEFCPRTLTFTIPGKNGNPGVQIKAVEDNGSIHFTVDVLGDADLRGLFFHLADETKLNGLAVSNESGLITNFVNQANSVINLGQGAESATSVSAFATLFPASARKRRRRCSANASERRALPPLQGAPSRQRDQGSAHGGLGRDNLVYDGTNANDLFTIGVAGEVPLNSRLVVNTVGAANDCQCLSS